MIVQKGFSDAIDSPAFLHAEKIFWEWFNHNVENDKDLEEMYFGTEAIYDKKGAIIQLLEQAEEVMEEKGVDSINLDSLDCDAAFG